MKTSLKKYKSFNSLKSVKRNEFPASIESPVMYDELNSFFKKLQNLRNPAEKLISKNSAHRNSR